MREIKKIDAISAGKIGGTFGFIMGSLMDKAGIDVVNSFEAPKTFVPTKRNKKPLKEEK